MKQVHHGHPSAAPGAGIALALALALLLPVMPDAGAQPGATAAAAEQFVRTDLERGLSIVDDRSITDAERREKLAGFLLSFMDIRRVALFSLGLERRSATPEQTERFVSAFREYALAYFESLLTNYYSGQMVRVTGCYPDGPSGFRVNLPLESPARTAKNDGQPIDLAVRVSDENGNLTITDVAAMGVWLGVQQREEVNDYLLERHGNFGGLIVRYESLARRKRGEVPDDNSSEGFKGGGSTRM